MLRLLIVDDQKTVAAGLLKLVDWESVGIGETFGANSANEARAVLNSVQIDVMLCDIEMPVENGLSLVKWMRTQGMQTKCIFLTAHADFSYARESVSLGAFDYVVQPAPYTEIKDAVRRAVLSIQNNGITIPKESLAESESATAPEEEIMTGGDVVDAIIKYIDENPEKEIHRSDLAELVHLNSDYLSRLFKQRTGQTLKEFIIEHKMCIARKMLQNTKLPVSIIAGKVGYDNFSHFSYTYKKVIGQSPLESRKANEKA